MHLDLNFTDSQAQVFTDIMDTTWRSLTYQENVVKTALEKEIDPTALGHMNDFLSVATAQRMLLEEILRSIDEAKNKSKIITDLTGTPGSLR